MATLSNLLSDLYSNEDRGAASAFLQAFYRLLADAPEKADPLLLQGQTHAAVLPDVALLGLLRFSFPFRNHLNHWNPCRDKTLEVLRERHEDEIATELMEGVLDG